MPAKATGFLHLLASALARLSLPCNHRVGACAGYLTLWFDQRHGRLMRENLAGSNVADSDAGRRRIARACIPELGKAATECFIAWLRPVEEVAALTREVLGWEHVEQARAAGRGILFITPHQGSIEIGSRYVASRIPITFMFAPAKSTWLSELMYQGRNRGLASVAPADRRGVRQMLGTLKAGGNICILPDQVPKGGEGVWVDFFGKPAYTMTLVGRLYRATGASVLFFAGERLPRGRGFRVVIEPLDQPLAEDPAVAARQINAGVEHLVRRCPEQYFWSYNRYQCPKGAAEKPGAPPRKAAA